jgi:hypothetical protein
MLQVFVKRSLFVIYRLLLAFIEQIGHIVTILDHVAIAVILILIGHPRNILFDNRYSSVR